MFYLNVAFKLGVWGRPGCELDAEYLDTKDPNYDSDEEAENVVMVCVDNPEPVKQNQNQVKILQTNEFESEVKLVVLEYFQNGDTFEVIDTLKCLNFSKVKPELIAYVISIALENNNTCKELMSRLLRDLKLEIFAGIEFESGFDILLRNLDDLSLDNPDAPEVFILLYFIINCRVFIFNKAT